MVLLNERIKEYLIEEVLADHIRASGRESWFDIKTALSLKVKILFATHTFFPFNS